MIELALTGRMLPEIEQICCGVWMIWPDASFSGDRMINDEPPTRAGW